MPDASPDPEKSADIFESIYFPPLSEAAHGSPALHLKPKQTKRQTQDRFGSRVHNTDRSPLRTSQTAEVENSNTFGFENVGQQKRAVVKRKPVSCPPSADTAGTCDLNCSSQIWNSPALHHPPRANEIHKFSNNNGNSFANGKLVQRPFTTAAAAQTVQWDKSGYFSPNVSMLQRKQHSDIGVASSRSPKKSLKPNFFRRLSRNGGGGGGGDGRDSAASPLSQKHFGAKKATIQLQPSDGKSMLAILMSYLEAVNETTYEQAKSRLESMCGGAQLDPQVLDSLILEYLMARCAINLSHRPQMNFRDVPVNNLSDYSGTASSSSYEDVVFLC